MMKSIPDIKDMKEELMQEDQNHHHKTLCFDIVNVLVRKINIEDPEEINLLKDVTNYEQFVIVETEKEADDDDSSGEFDH